MKRGDRFPIPLLALWEELCLQVLQYLRARTIPSFLPIPNLLSAFPSTCQPAKQNAVMFGRGRMRKIGAYGKHCL
jgi:hypothetical protein